MYGDLSTWLSLPDKGNLPTRKFIGDDDAIVFNKGKSCSRTKANEVKPLLVALVTDSMNLASSTDNLNYRKNNNAIDSDLDDSFDFDRHHSAFSYYSESTDVATSMSVDKDSRNSSFAKKNLSPRKCVSCPEAARLSLSELSMCSSVSPQKANRVFRSLETTLLGDYQNEDQPYDVDVGTITLDTAADFRESVEQPHSFTNYASTSNSSTSSFPFFTDEDAADYSEDDCSRVSYVSVFRSSPVLFDTATDETAASLNILANDSVRLTYTDTDTATDETATDETATDETAASLNILSEESVRRTYVTPAPSPYRNKLHRMPARGCKTCTLDGLKNHPACPSSSFHKPRQNLSSSNTWATSGDLNIIYS